MTEKVEVSGKVLTIIIPMYQSESFIKKCLDSMVLGRTDLEKLEVLVVNDGSKDCSAALVQEYVYRYPDTVRLINKENGGHGSAVNRGISQCRGRFFKVVDADDWVCTQGLAKILQTLEHQAGRADVVLAAYRMHDIRDGNMEMVSCGRDAAGTWTGLCGVLQDWGRYRRLLTLHGLIYQTDFYRTQDLQLPEHVYYDDAYFDVVPAAHARRIYVSDTVLYEYRIGDENQSISRRNRETRLGELENVLFQICETLEEGQTLSEAGKCYWYRRTASFVADYYATALIRAENRRRGRMAARAFSNRLKQENRKLWRMSRLKFFVLFFMHVIRLKEEYLEALFRIRERAGFRYGGKKRG